MLNFLILPCLLSITLQGYYVPTVESLRKRDSIIKSINLRGGYRLVYKATHTANLVLVERGGVSNEAGEEQSDPKMPLDVLGYLYADFDNTFALVTRLNDSPMKVTIYDKKTGGMLFYGKTPFYLDTVRGIMLYEGAYGKAGMLVLYDSHKNNTELFPAPTDSPCFCCCCWKATEVSASEIMIEYVNMKMHLAVKRYER